MTKSYSKETLENLRSVLLDYAISLGCSKGEAADIVHDCILKAFEKRILETSESTRLPYLRKMVKNRFIDEQRSRLTLMEDTEILRVSDYTPEKDEDYKALLAEIGKFLEKHKYGYIIYEKERRGVKSIKDLAPYTNEKPDKLYKRYQKLLKDLEAYFKGG